jgi:uncharacterized damage-inducible protein DinB
MSPDDHSHTVGPYALRYARVLATHPSLAVELVSMASEIVDDFDDWGPVIQGDEDGTYSESTAIARLRAARDEFIRLVDARSSEPWPLRCIEYAAAHRTLPNSGAPLMPPPSLSELAGYQRTFEREFQTTLKLLRLFPADRLDLKPSEKSGTAAQTMWTLVIGQMVIGKMAHLEEVQPGGFPPPPDTLPAIIAAFEQAHSDTAAALARLTDADMDASVPFMVGPKQMGDLRRGDVLWLFLYDGIHHRGQLTVYQRMAGGKVPSIYGPSGDEPWA